MLKVERRASSGLIIDMFQYTVLPRAFIRPFGQALARPPRTFRPHWHSPSCPSRISRLSDRSFVLPHFLIRDTSVFGPQVQARSVTHPRYISHRPCIPSHSRYRYRYVLRLSLLAVWHGHRFVEPVSYCRQTKLRYVPKSVFGVHLGSWFVCMYRGRNRTHRTDDLHGTCVSVRCACT